MYHPCRHFAILQSVEYQENDDKDVHQPFCRPAAYINLHGACLLRRGRLH